MSAPLHWGVIAVLADGRGIGRCPHEHETDLDAVRCAWEPRDWPRCCDLLVRQFRTAQRYQLALPGAS